MNTDSSHDNANQFGRASVDRRPENSPIEEETPPVKKQRRSSGARNRLVVFFNFLMTITVLGAVAAGFAVYFGMQRFDTPGPLGEETTFVVEKGAGLNWIADGLEAKGIIDQSMIFRLGVQISREQRGLQAGEYAFKPGMSMRQVMNILTSGKAILHAFAVPEGLTSLEIMRRLGENEVLRGDMPPIPAEGALLPETYRFQRGTTRETIISQMIQSQDKTLAEIWQNRAPDLPITTPQELVTLASIVEKETGVASERPLVASVFINRLKKGMRLQSDPTIIYGIFGGKGKPRDRPIYRSDIDKPTPYNTYTIPALPPGPIANPGRASLEAVANPAQSDFLFFVADGTGGHAFAKTLKEHQANVVKWRAIEKKLKAEAKKADTSN